MNHARDKIYTIKIFTRNLIAIEFLLELLDETFLVGYTIIMKNAKQNDDN